MGLSRARAPGEYHIALSEALREAAVARFSEWLRQVRSAAGQHPTWLATFESAERLAVTRIPLPSGWRRSQAQGLAATRTPGSVGTVRLRVVLNLINPSRAQSTGNQIYPSGRDRQLTDLRFSSALQSWR